jgi:hypothetical protein
MGVSAKRKRPLDWRPRRQLRKIPPHDQDGEIIPADPAGGEVEPRTVPSNLSGCCSDVTRARRFRRRVHRLLADPHPPGAAIAARPEQLSRYSLKAKDDQGFVNLKQILISTV